jgi:hypothetical protein
MQARGLLTSILSWGLHKLKSLSIHLRDLTSDEFAGRDYVDEFITLLRNPAAREPSPRQETHARGIPDGHEIVARGATLDFFNSILKTLEAPQELTSDQMLDLAMIGRRALDELD